MIIHSERLLLRYIEYADAPFILQLLNTPGWLQYIGDRKVHSIEDAERYILNGPMKSYEDKGFGLLLVIEKMSGIPIGICGLLKRDHLPHPDLGFAFLPEHMGKGYAFEAGTAVLNYGQASLHIDTIAAITLPDNTASVSLLKKLGFVFEALSKFDDDPEELCLFIRKKEA